MAEYTEIEITHCCASFDCLTNWEGHHVICPVCGSRNVNYHRMYRCEECWCDWENESDAGECCPDAAAQAAEEVAS
jgi:hypothetical protein